MEILYDEPYGTLEFDETIPAVIGHFTTHMSSFQFREFLTIAAQKIGEKFNELQREVVWIANTREHTVQTHDDTRWVSDVWNPLAYQYGVRHVGFVIPEKLFGLAAVENYVRNNYKRNKMVMEVMMFNELENARKWYRKVLRENYLRQQKRG